MSPSSSSPSVFPDPSCFCLPGRRASSLGAVFFLFVCLGVPAHAATIANGLAAHWRLDEGAGTTAADASGNGNTGTLVNGARWTTNANATVLEFDGVNDLVMVTARNFNGTGNLTLAARIKRNRTGGSAAGYIFGSNRLGIYVDRDNKRICYSDSVSTRCTNFNSVQLGVWQHVVVVQDITNSRVTFYINGVATLSGGRPNLVAATQFSLGNYPTTAGNIRPFAGLMSDVQVYTRALTAAEVQTVYGGQATPAPQFNFTLANGGDRSVVAGAAVTNAITATLTSGSVQSVAFAVTGLPAGATATFSASHCSPTCSTTLTLTTSASAPAGTATVTVTGTGAGITKTTSFNLTVTRPFDFTLTNGGDQSVTAGTTISHAIATMLLDGTPQPVSFSVAGLPASTSATFSAPQCTPTCSTTLMITTSTATPEGTAAVTVTGSAGDLARTTTFNVTVLRPFDFTLANGGDLSVLAGAVVSNTLTTSLLDGAPQLVSFSVAGLPAGTTTTFSTPQCTPTCSTTLTLTTSAATPAGTTAVTVTGSGGGVTRTTTFNLTVTRPFDFSLANGGSRSLQVGTSTANAITTTLLDGAPQAVSFSVAGLPTDTTATFATAQCTPTCSTTLTLATSESTPTGTTAVMVTGSGGGVTKTTTFNLTVTQPTTGDEVAYWPLDDGSGTVATDVSSNGNHGVLLNGVAWTNGRNGSALAFDGVDEYVTAHSAADDFDETAGTIAVWLHRTFLDSAQKYHTPISIGAGANDVVEVFYLPSTDQFRFHYKAGGVNRVVDASATQIPVNQWAQVALSWDTIADTFKAYINGQQIGTTQTALGTWASTTTKVSIGSSITSAPGADAWQGLVDDVRVYNRSLSDAEIQNLYNDQPPPPPPSEFDFTVTNGGDRLVTLGDFVTNTIATTLTVGTGQIVSFSAVGLPFGATASFTTGQCTPSCATDVRIVTNLLTPVGTSIISVVAVGGGVTRTTTFNLTVDAAPLPSPSTETGVSDAPLTPANQRILVVAQDGSGDYTTLTDAEAATQPGDTVQIKNGNYREQLRPRRSGTRELPITYMAYPGHRPILENWGIKIEASWLIIEGLEIANAENGINLAAASASNPYSHITIRNNYIHDSGFMGAFIAATPHVLVENNTFERNGLGPDNCTSDLWGGQNYSHCHGIYLSNPAFACSSQMSNVTIRRNRFLGNSGSGIQVYSNCSESEKHFHHLIENNLFVNNATGMYLWSVRSSIIRNNTIVQLDWPRPQINALVGLDLLGAAANLLANNVVYAPDIESAVIRTWHPTSNIWTNNALFAKGDASWHWELVPAVFSLAQYQQKSGDPAPVGATIADPSVDVAGFVNLLGGDYHLTASSLLRNSGASAHCPAVDLDGRPRPQETQCDIGAYEFE